MLSRFWNGGGFDLEEKMKFFFLRFFDYESEALLVFEVEKEYPSAEKLCCFEKSAEHAREGGEFPMNPGSLNLFSFYESVLEEDFENSTFCDETPPFAWMKFGFFKDLKRLSLEVVEPNYEIEVYGHFSLKESKSFWYLKEGEFTTGLRGSDG